MQVASVDANLAQKVELFVSCTDLMKADVMSKSDPVAVLYQLNELTGQWAELGRTEQIMNNQDPSFAKQFTLDYLFEQMQDFRVDVYDVDNNGPLEQQDFLGYARFKLSEVVTAPGQKRHLKLLSKQNQPMIGARGTQSTCTIHCEQVQRSNDFLVFAMSAKDIEKKSWFSGTSPFCEIFRLREDNSWIKVFTSKTVNKNCNPNWGQFKLSVQTLCNGDFSRPLVFKCWHSGGQRSEASLLGEHQFTLRDLQQANSSGNSYEFAIKHPERAKKDKSYKDSGRVFLRNIQFVKEYSFLEYIEGGCQVSLAVAIDFTASNGPPCNLHVISPNPAYLNEYQRAIVSIGNIVAPYDSDQMFPVWGFGARVNGQVSHCFPLTFDPNKPEVYGVAGILDAYNRSFANLQLSGPTLFSEIIDTTAALASAPFSAEQQHYHILLIITDGIINDMDRTKQSIINASDLPMSIIIVGVGQADFSQMHELDSDEKLLSVGQAQAKRDIVQFVSMRDFANKHVSLLAKETLAEIPGQILQFMKQHRVQPNPPLRSLSMMPGGAPQQPQPAMQAMQAPQVQQLAMQPQAAFQPQQQQRMSVGAVQMAAQAQYPQLQPTAPPPQSPGVGPAPTPGYAMPPAYAPQR